MAASRYHRSVPTSSVRRGVRPRKAIKSVAKAKARPKRRASGSAALARVAALPQYAAACRAVAEAKSVDEAKEIRNQAEALRAYAQQANNKQLEIDAASIRIRAERRLGQLIDQQKKSIGLNRGAAGSRVTGSKRVPVKDVRPTLAEAGIDKKLSSRSQQLAAMPEPQFIAMLDQWRDRVAQSTERVTTNLLRDRARAVESTRDEELTEADLAAAEADLAFIRAEAAENQARERARDELLASPPYADRWQAVQTLLSQADELEREAKRLNERAETLRDQAAEMEAAIDAEIDARLDRMKDRDD